VAKAAPIIRIGNDLADIVFYKFPKNSEFGRLDMKTVGTVFANVKNKY